MLTLVIVLVASIAILYSPAREYKINKIHRDFIKQQEMEAMYWVHLKKWAPGFEPVCLPQPRSNDPAPNRAMHTMSVTPGIHQLNLGNKKSLCAFHVAYQGLTVDGGLLQAVVREVDYQFTAVAGYVQDLAVHTPQQAGYILSNVPMQQAIEAWTGNFTSWDEALPEEGELVLDRLAGLSQALEEVTHE